MILRFKPNRVPRTYLGGSRIDRLHGSTDAHDGYYPEEWIASVTVAQNARSLNKNEGLSVCDGGRYDGRTLLDILTAEPELLGDYKKLPILLKLLDASERLVIQAHPTDEFARKYWGSEFGKAECWYAISADPGAHVYLGFREGTTRQEWERCFHAQDIDKMLSMLHKITLREGDVWYVDGGVPHAIGGGCLLAELQEPSDLMVVPERRTPSGRILPEERLHGGLGFERMFDCFNYDVYTPDELKRRFFRHPEKALNRAVRIIDHSLTGKFSMEEYDIDGEVLRKPDRRPSAAVVVEGSGAIKNGDGILLIKAGDTLFIPANEGGLLMSGKMRILTAEP